MRIGDVARELGVSRDTLRRLEARGLIEPARDWIGQRRYSREDLAALRAKIFRAPAATSEPRSRELV
jgi:DNA-binding transcriptional MerR regulator